MCTLPAHFQMTDRAISDLRARPGDVGGAEGGERDGGVWGAGGAAPGSGPTAGGTAGAGVAPKGEDGPHTV